MNSQKPEPRARGNGDTLDLHSMFYTLQGEGPFTGCPAVFIRLAGCNLQCPGCDTEYTEGRELLPVTEVFSRAIREVPGNIGTRCIMVITGGEPLRQDIGTLVSMLMGVGYTVQIESNGVFAPSPELANLLDWSRRSRTKNLGKVVLIVSPKTKAINKTTASYATAFKYVIDRNSVNPDDGLPILALDHPAAGGVARPPQGFTGEIYVNPFDAKDDEINYQNLSAAAHSALLHGYRLGVQLHKLVGLD